MITKQIFRAILNELAQNLSHLTKTKGEEYTANDDQLANFRQSAAEAGVSMEQVWLVFFNKHFSAIRYYVKNNRVESTESINSRIDDAILYLALLRAMVAESEGAERKYLLASAPILDEK